jgi:HSP20 family protein
MPHQTKAPGGAKASAGKAGTGKRPAAGRGHKEKAAEAEPKISAGATIRTAAGGGPLGGVDNLFSWLGGIVGQLGEIVEKTKEGEFARHGEFKPHGLGEKARGVYGVSVRMGIGGQPSFEPFGNIRPTAKGPEMSDVREPLVDVFDEENEVLVVAEMPGAPEKEISVTVEGNKLRLTAEGDHRYAKEVELPAAVDPEPVRKVYRNGLLEMRFAKA